MNEKISPHFFHFLNDRSGSPRVLAQVIKGFSDLNITSHLHCSEHDGFLSDLRIGAGEVERHPLPYDYSSNKIILLLIFTWNQLVCFQRILFLREKNALIYVNTILPAGAIFAGWLRGFPVINHVHETSIKPKALKWLLMSCSKRFSTKLISVSNFLANEESLPKGKTSVIYNALPAGYLENGKSSDRHKLRETGNLHILMLCSLKDYKGIPEFLALAGSSPKHSFELVINSDEASIESYFEQKDPLPNIKVWPSQKDVRPFYQRADLVLNLSRPDQWVETFGLTAIEAMAYGLPVIVPPVGGIAEVVGHEKEGFHVDCRDTIELLRVIELLSRDPELYELYSSRAKERAADFSLQKLQQSIQAEAFKLFPNIGTHSRIYTNTELNSKVIN